MDYSTYSNGKFSPNQQQEPAKRFRNALGKRIDMFTQQKNMPSESVAFVFKKYYAIFSDRYGGETTFLPLILARVKDLKKK